MDTNTAIRALRANGHAVDIIDPVTVAIDGDEYKIARTRANPTPSDVQKALDREWPTRALILADSPSRSIWSLAATDPRVAVVAANGDTAVRTKVLATLKSEIAGKRSQRGRLPYARHAIARALLSQQREWTQTSLAKASGTSQGSVSQALPPLWDELHASADSARHLIERLILEYPGAGGITTYWWDDRPIRDQAIIVESAGALLSGDIAAERIRGWRTPEHVVAYAENPIDMARLGFVSAEAGEYTTELIIPADTTILATAETYGNGVADPIIASHDVIRTATTGDAAEQAKALIDYVLDRRAKT